LAGSRDEGAPQVDIAALVIWRTFTRTEIHPMGIDKRVDKRTLVAR